jgi:translocation and assembly module TamA
VHRCPHPARGPVRPRAWARAGLLACALGAGCVHIRGTLEQPAVFRVRFEGLKHLDKSDLAAHLATHESEHSPPIPIIGPLIHQVAGARQELAQLQKPPPIPIVGPTLYALRGTGKNSMVSLLDPDQLAVDRRRIEAYAHDRGYYDARVLDARVIPVGPGQVDVIFEVEEGEPVRVAKIEITGMESAPEASEAVRRPALKEGDIFTVAAYDALHAQLGAALQDRGWETAEVKQEAHVLPDKHTADVRYEVQTGPRFRFGPIFVSGAAAVSKDRIQRRARDEISPGAWFDHSKLAVAQGRVFAMGVFAGVRVIRGTPDAERGIIPVVVTVREAPFRSVRLGPQLGVVSGNRVDISGVAGWTHRNFLGDIRKLDLSLTAGFAWLLTKPPKEGPVGVLAADFSQTDLGGRPVDLGAHVDLQRGLEQGYDFWAQRARLSLPVHISRRVAFVPSYNFEVYELFNALEFPNPDDPTKPLPSPVLASCQRPGASTTRGICLLSYLEQRIEWDRRDDPIVTRRGFYLSFAVQEGAHVAGYGYQYLRFVPEARIFIPVGERSVIAARARLGAFVPVAETRLPPTVALFTAGGPSSMRGYGQDRLSPYSPGAPATDTTAAIPPVPVGGNGLAEYSVEMRFPVRGSLFGAVFLDAGYVSYRSHLPTAYQYALDPRRLQWALGLGVRYRTPVGPLRLDVATRLPTNLARGVPFSDRFPSVPSSIPGVPSEHHEPIVVLHLSVGEAF